MADKPAEPTTPPVAPATPPTPAPAQPAATTAAPPATGSVPTGVHATGTEKIGPNGPLPDELKGWNWGAFLLTWIWGAAHSVWWAFLVFVPYVGFVMAIVLGIKGNEWAWQAKKYDSVAQYQAIQKKWTKWGIILIILTFVLTFVTILATGLLVSKLPASTTIAPTSTESSVSPTADISPEASVTP